MHNLLEVPFEDSAVIGREETEKVAMHFGHMGSITRLIVVLRDKFNKIISCSNNPAGGDE